MAIVDVIGDGLVDVIISVFVINIIYVVFGLAIKNVLNSNIFFLNLDNLGSDGFFLNIGIG